ncbi:hypothetical protein BKA24_002497 [Microbacterium marinum]|uniref:Uncharacterized protein n=1 Tax=Microbacterium marinum TaxID=421115 RepID=A0A7W7BUD9_9MICO|nr:hypothetical protein [Microbacterium marinum]MBB4667788.1 hypothetical protein [Microbacterium marinum]
MSYRTRETLEAWLTDFRNARSAGGAIKVVIQDGSGGRDTGLIVVPLKSSNASIHIEPGSPAGDGWRITIDALEDTTILDSHQLQELAHELAVAAELCAYLESRAADG